MIIRNQSYLRTRPSSLGHLCGATCLVTSLVVSLGACADPSEISEQTSPELDRAKRQAHPAVSAMPRVDYINLGDEYQTEVLAGRLGTDMELVAEAFEIDHSSLAVQSSVVDSLGVSVVRFAQQRNGLEVVNGDLRITRDADDNILSATGSSWGASEPTVDASISGLFARKTAKELTVGATESSQARLVYIAPSTGTTPVLAWETRLTGEQANGIPLIDDVYISATTGELVARLPQVHAARNRLTYDATGEEGIAGTLARSEGDSSTGDSDVDLAHEAAGLTYDCFKDLFNRDSYDNQGAALTSLTHYRDKLSQPTENAFWITSNDPQESGLMVYGDGYAIIDIGVHEMSHALTDATANLVYENESGALNEAWSDVMSAVCDAHLNGVTANTWLLGEAMDINNDINAIRILSNPSQDGHSRDHYSTLYQGELDNGGVHINSGIANLAFYLLSEGGVHPQGRSSQVVEGISIFPAGQIFYRALTTYMGENTNFEGARTATVLAANDLFGADSSESISVHEAWAAVGVGGPPPARNGDGDPENGSNDNDNGTGEEAGTADTGSNNNSGSVQALSVSGTVSRRQIVRFDGLSVLPGSTVTVNMTGTGDVDLYVNFDQAATRTKYVCRPYEDGSEETCSLTVPADATSAHIMVYGYRAGSYELSASYVAP